MYEPAHFKVEDRAALFEVIRAHPLAQLVTAGPGGLMANPIPFVLAGEPGQEVLRAHLARPNPQWQELKAGAEPLVIFQSVEHYISPSWYATKAETHKVVPTWNYIVVQVRGRARVNDSRAWLHGQIDRLTRQHETKRAEPWSVNDAPEPFVEAQMRGIVGVEIEIREITGKFKLSQNRKVEDRQGVVEGLAGEGDAQAEAMRALIAAHLARTGA
ncbi:MAG: transcriptional regulator [Methylobacterium sp.]|nr:MAG: transcriptional regulator [Methylobacterium sp.]